MAQENTDRVGTMIEELGARFELIIEAVTGFGGRLESLRDEIFGQFAEVGGQIRFLSEQIAENRRGIATLRADLGAEMIRLGEALGKTRVEFREQLAASEIAVRGAISTTLARQASEAPVEIERDASGGPVITDNMIQARLGEAREELSNQMAETAKTIKREIALSAETAAKKLGAELKHTNKALADLARKFERFDDRITIQTRDQDQRIRKIERKGRA